MMVGVCLQATLESGARYLRNSPVKLVDMVDECEDYVCSLRNLAIEVLIKHTHTHTVK